MARFLISPGVITREVDNSQYAATNPGLGNIAALVGYAEKGPFEPTLVTGTQNFVEKFGKTLANAPYLAQAAYKYFEENDTLLVVRAGNNQDPEAYPNAAQYSSLKVRLNPTNQNATAGYQKFVPTADVQPGMFSSGASYGFKVLADFRAFKTPKYLEKWNGMAVETANSLGPSPMTSIYETVFKTAFTSSSASAFEANYKRKHSAGSTAEYYGTGTKSGSSFGDTVSATLYKYRDNDTYADDPTDFIVLNGSYAANAVGSVNILDGKDFSTTSGTLVITLGAVAYTVTLDEAFANADALAAGINTALETADDGTGVVDISNRIEASVLKQTATTAYLRLVKKSSTNTGFTLGGTALATLGLTSGEYLDSKGIIGTWHAETVLSGTPQTFSGVFSYTLQKTEAAALSFEDYAEISVAAPLSGTWTLSDIASQIQTGLNTAFTAYNHPQARGIAAVAGDGKITITASDLASTMASIVKIEAPSSGNSLITLLGGVESPVNGLSPSSVGEAVYTIKAKEKGSYGQKLILRTEEKRVNLGPEQVIYHNIYVLLDGYEVRTYQKINWTNPEDANFFLTRMASDPYVSIDAEDEDGDEIFAQLPNGDWALGQSELPNGVTTQQAEIVSYTVGTNGWTESNGLITSMSADLKKALEKLYNPEVYDFNLVAAPGSADPIVQNAIQDLCESRKDCFGIVDAAPFGLGLGIKEGLNSVVDVTSSCNTINSSYVGVFWPWCQDYDADNEQYVWLPPSVYALKSMVYTDNVADPWYAPAGTSRGKVSALDVEYSPSRGDRDLLYGDTNIVNPIVYFVNEGITIWGQKTGQRVKSATDRINVRRLMIYAEKLIANMARGFLFEPHDSANWAAFTRQANAILEPIRQRRGLYQYSVVCDSSTNTADLINQNIMAGKIYLQPLKSVEFIEVEFTINATGEVTVAE